MKEEARLIMTDCSRGEALAHKRSRCGRVFLLPEDRSPNEAAAEVILPCSLPDQPASPTAPERLHYYTSIIQKGALLGLPISFRGTLWKQLLYRLPEFLNLQSAVNPR